MKTGDAYISYPLLYTICASLVERLVSGDVIAYLLVRQFFEGNVGGNGKTSFL